MANKYWRGNIVGSEGDINVAENWTPTGVPVDGDVIVFRNSSQSATENLDQFSGFSTAKLRVEDSFTGQVGAENDPLLGEFAYVSVDGGVVFLDLESAAVPNVFHSDGILSIAGDDVGLVVTSGGVLNCGFNGSVTGDLSISELVISSFRSSIPRPSSGQHTINVGGNIDPTITNIRAIATAYTMNANSGTVSRMDVVSGIVNLNGMNLASLWQWGGVIYLNADATYTTHRLLGGAYVANSNSDAKSVTTFSIYDSAVAYLSSVTFTTLTVYGSPDVRFNHFVSVS